MIFQKLFLILSLLLPLLVVGQSSPSLFVEQQSFSSFVLDSYSISINPRGTYLRTHMNDDAQAPSFFSLSNRNINPGEILYLMAEGDFRASYFHIDNIRSMLGVFVNSSGNYLAPASNYHRSEVSLPSFNGGLLTDIPEDFGIPFQADECVKVEIPNNAERILFSPNDAHFEDNTDPNGDLGVNIRIINIPEVEIGYSNPMQVIEAPQLDASQDYYDEPYDLVANKPFAVRVGFHKLSETLTAFTFEPVLKIKKYNAETDSFDIIKTSNRCSNKTGEGIDTQSNVSDCNFESDHFMDTTEGEFYPDVFNEVFIVEGGIDEPGRYTVEVDLYPNMNDIPCIDSQNITLSFEVEVHKIKSPQIGLAIANCDHIEDCETPTNLGGFLRSEEVSLFNTLFPVSEGDKKFFPIPYNLGSNIKRILVNITSEIEEEGYEEIISLALSTISLATHKILFNYDYLVGIGSEDFFTNVGVGLRTGASGIAFIGLPAPFNRVAFVRSDQENKGTLLHELAHLLGQSKDFYDSESYCTAHELKIEENNYSSRLCHEFNNENQGRAYTGYNFKNHNFAYMPQSIMGGLLVDSNDQPIPNQLDELWMDRDTYITTFKELKNPSPDPELTLFSGIYMNGQLFNGKVSNHDAGILHPLSTEGDLRIMLKDSSGQVLSESKVPSSIDIELLSEDGGGEHITSPIVPIVVAFPYNSQATQLVLMKVNEDDSETMVFSKDLLPDTNPGYSLSNHYTYSTVDNFPVLRNTPGADLVTKDLTNTSSAIFSKFMYAPGVRVAFDYNACSDNSLSSDGIALLFGKNPEDYSSTLPTSNQGASFNQTGMSLHLDMSGEIQLKNSRGGVLASTSHQVDTGCSNWEKIKVRINRNGKLLVLQGSETLLEFKLTPSQLEAVSNQPIGWSAYSSDSGQYKVAGIRIDSIPFERKETAETEE